MPYYDKKKHHVITFRRQFAVKSKLKIGYAVSNIYQKPHSISTYKKSFQQDLNLRPLPYHGSALPLSYRGAPKLATRTEYQVPGRLQKLLISPARGMVKGKEMPVYKEERRGAHSGDFRGNSWHLDVARHIDV